MARVFTTYQLNAAWRVSLPEELRQDIRRTEHFEGAAATVMVNRYEYERDRAARSKCIAHYGCTCNACGINLVSVYGAAADGFIYVYHLKPISSVKAEYELDPICDLRPLCPNCHAIAHLRREPYSIEEIESMMVSVRKNC